MHTAALARGAAPPPSIVLGLLMCPYSLGHELLLVREGNPLADASPQKPASMADLRQAAWICSNTWHENTTEHLDWLSGFKARIWKWRTRRALLPAEIARFIFYRTLGTLEFKPSDAPRPDHRQAGRSPGTPFLLRLHEFLVTHARLTDAEAWDHPYGYAKMRWENWAESEGALDIYNHQDAEFDRFVAEQEAKGSECLAS